MSSGNTRSCLQRRSWLRSLPLAKSSCAKIRRILSVLFNHACRHELFGRNPIRLVRQGGETAFNTKCTDTRGDKACPFALSMVSTELA
jgi:hypothetical protein